MESISSEGIIFAHALKYPDLKADVVATAMEIVNFSRRHNDTRYLWNNDLGVFGLEALMTLALKHSEYSYLVGSFLIPYWDSEHADYAFYHDYTLVDEYNMSDDILKMFCYCDNSEFRRVILGGDIWGEEPFETNYVEYFEENPERYARFKELMLERFKEQPYIQYSEQDYNAYPIHQFYRSILETALDEDEEDPLDNIYAPWDSFFKDGFGHGDRVWKYILDGKNPEILESIKAFDLMHYTKEKDLDLYKLLDYHASELEPVDDILHYTFGEFIDDYFEAPETNNFIVTINGEDPSGRTIVLRALDIVQRILGRPLACSLYEQAINSELIHTKDFYIRYDAVWKNSAETFNFLWEQLSGYYFNLQSTKLTRLYNYLNHHRDNICKDVITKWSPNYDTIAFCFFALDQDQKNNTADDLSKTMEAHIENHWLEAFCRTIEEESSLTEDEMQLIKSFIDGTSSSENQTVDINNAIELLNTKLDFEIEGSNELKHYDVLDDFYESLSILIPALYFGARRRL